ncbi:MAG: ABC transporter permease subunit [Planctomycetes bacterium]|nr:ABC transporter permease subunit [Planctomycetota bacterium]MCP4770145.1 ABC transporter permease subunit [Planctomycetota bacterium]MCP4860707.1 ABC transporter permease subunit [Planctomycetota bacterium]
MSDRLAQVEALRKSRPRSRLIRWSAMLAVVCSVLVWLTSDISLADMFSTKRLGHLDRFITNDMLPAKLRGDAFTWGGLGDWCGEQFQLNGARAMLATLCISVLAIVLAAVAGAMLGAFGARNLMSAHPFLPHATVGHGDCSHWLDRVAQFTRLICILLRAVPEYIWAYLLLAMLGTSAWPAVLALAIHNAGILGRLAGETIENLPSQPLRALSMAGGTRRDVAVVGVFPMALGRYLLYFFYRFETCVREATVLGMLGVVSLGYYVIEARAHGQYSTMLFLIFLGGLLVMLADIVSDVARRWLQKGI